MNDSNGAPTASTGLSSLRDEAATASSPKASIPSALLPMEVAPKDRLIVGYCVHDADPYLDGPCRLTTYAAHVEGLSRVVDGYHVLEWGGAYRDTDEWSGSPIYIDDWWFRFGSELEEAANPVGWLPLPLASGIEAATADETQSGSAVGESPVPKADAQ